MVDVPRKEEQLGFSFLGGCFGLIKSSIYLLADGWEVCSSYIKLSGGVA